MRRIIAVATGFLLCQSVFATTIYKVAISEVYKKSDIVLFGTIQSGRALADDCGVEYTVRVQSPFKGKIHPGSLITFRSGGLTQIGAEYFLFLSTLKNEFVPIASTNSGFTNMQAQYIKRCQSKWPSFVVNAFGNGALKSTGTYKSGLPRAVLFDDFVLAPPKSLKVIKLGPHDRYDNDTDATAFDAKQFMSYMKGLSSAK